MVITKIGKLPNIALVGKCKRCGCEVNCQPSYDKIHYKYIFTQAPTVFCPTHNCKEYISLHEQKEGESLGKILSVGISEKIDNNVFPPTDCSFKKMEEMIRLGKEIIDDPDGYSYEGIINILTDRLEEY